jgi:hypothetical protein
MVQTKRLIIGIFILISLSLETKDLNAWNLFDKKFDSQSQCQQYVLSQTNDYKLAELAVGLGCNNRYNSPEKIFLPNRSFLEITRKKESIASAIERIILDNPHTFDKIYKGTLALPDGTSIAVKKPISGKEFWRTAVTHFPNSFSALIWDPNLKYADFGTCMINNLSEWLDMPQKYKGIIKCGDKAGIARNETLYWAYPFSQESIRQEAEQRARDSAREAYRENIRRPLNCIWIGEILDCH